MKPAERTLRVDPADDPELYGALTEAYINDEPYGDEYVVYSTIWDTRHGVYVDFRLREITDDGDSI